MSVPIFVLNIQGNKTVMMAAQMDIMEDDLTWKTPKRKKRKKEAVASKSNKRAKTGAPVPNSTLLTVGTTDIPVLLLGLTQTSDTTGVPPWVETQVINGTTWFLTHVGQTSAKRKTARPKGVGPMNYAIEHMKRQGHSVLVQRDVSSGKNRVYGSFCDNDALCDHLLQPTPHHLYEILQREQPVRLYADIDGPNLVNHEGKQATTEHFIRAIHEVLEETFSRVKAPQPYDKSLARFTKSVGPDDAGKHEVSLHFVYSGPMYTKDAVAQKAFWEAFVEVRKEIVPDLCYTNMDKVCEYIDLAVYTSNRAMRTILSSKGGRKKVLRAVDHEGKQVPTDAASSMQAFLITAVNLGADCLLQMEEPAPESAIKIESIDDVNWYYTDVKQSLRPANYIGPMATAMKEHGVLLRRDREGQMLFGAMPTHDALCAVLLRSERQHTFHEILRAGHRVRLFADLDGNNLMNEKGEIEPVSAITSHMDTILAETFVRLKVPTAYDPRLAKWSMSVGSDEAAEEAARHRVSLHFVYDAPIVTKDAATQKSFWTTFIAVRKELASGFCYMTEDSKGNVVVTEYVDLAVYGKNKSMRTVLSWKDGRQLQPIASNGQQLRRIGFDPRPYLVTAVGADDALISLADVKGRHHAACPVQIKREELEAIVDAKVPGTHIGKIDGNYVYLVNSQRDGRDCQVSPGTMHKSNNSSLAFDAAGNLFHFCFSEKCKGKRLLVSTGHMMVPEEEKKVWFYGTGYLHLMTPGLCPTIEEIDSYVASVTLRILRQGSIAFFTFGRDPMVLSLRRYKELPTSQVKRCQLFPDESALLGSYEHDTKMTSHEAQAHKEDIERQFPGKIVTFSKIAGSVPEMKGGGACYRFSERLHFNRRARHLYESRVAPTYTHGRLYPLAPTEEQPVEMKDVFNLFRGWPFSMPTQLTPSQELEEVLKLGLDHNRDIMCAGDQDAHKYILDWFAHIIQKPREKAEVMLLFISEEGSGKDIWLSYLRRVIGISDNTYAMSGIERLMARFNLQRAGKLLCVISELKDVSNRRDCTDQLKDALTAERIQVEPKGKEIFEITDLCRYIGTTNNPHGLRVPPKHRRGFTMRCSDAKINQAQYFTELVAGLKGTEAAMFEFLATRDITDFHPRQVPFSRSNLRLLLKDKQMRVLLFLFRAINERGCQEECGGCKEEEEEDKKNADDAKSDPNQPREMDIEEWDEEVTHAKRPWCGSHETLWSAYSRDCLQRNAKPGTSDSVRAVMKSHGFEPNARRMVGGRRERQYIIGTSDVVVAVRVALRLSKTDERVTEQDLLLL
jgi:hypothetical protein